MVSMTFRVRITSKIMATITESTIAVGTPTFTLMPYWPSTTGLKSSRMKSGSIGRRA